MKRKWWIILLVVEAVVIIVLLCHHKDAEVVVVDHYVKEYDTIYVQQHKLVPFYVFVQQTDTIIDTILIISQYNPIQPNTINLDAKPMIKKRRRMSKGKLTYNTELDNVVVDGTFDIKRKYVKNTLGYKIYDKYSFGPYHKHNFRSNKDYYGIDLNINF